MILINYINEKKKYDELKKDYNSIISELNKKKVDDNEEKEQYEIEKINFKNQIISIISELNKNENNYQKKNQYEVKKKHLSKENTQLKTIQFKQDSQSQKLKKEHNDLQTKFKSKEEELKKISHESKRNDKQSYIIEKGIINLEYKNYPKKNNLFENEHFSIFPNKKSIRNELNNDVVNQEPGNTDNNNFVNNIQLLIAEKEKLKSEIKEMNEQKNKLSLVLTEIQSKIKKEDHQNLKQISAINNVNNNKSEQKELIDNEIIKIMEQLDKLYNISSIFEENEIKEAIKKANGDENKIQEILFE